MATSFFSEISYHFKRILSKIKFIWFGSRKFWFFFLLLFKIVILYFWQFLAFGFQVGWHHYFIHLPLAQKLGIDKFVKEVAITLLFIKTVAWLSPKPLDEISQDYKQWFFSGLFTTPKHRHHYFVACFEQKQENEKKKNNNKGCQEIIGLILFGKNPKITATHRNVVVLCHRIEKNKQTHFLFILISCVTARRMARTLVHCVCAWMVAWMVMRNYQGLVRSNGNDNVA